MKASPTLKRRNIEPSSTSFSSPHTHTLPNDTTRRHGPSHFRTDHIHFELSIMSENQDGALPRAQPLPKRTAPPRTSRPRPAQPGNEEAGAVLNLGEFQDVDTLTLSEASLVINALIAKRRMDHRNVNETEYVSFLYRTWMLVPRDTPNLARCITGEYAACSPLGGRRNEWRPVWM